MSQIIAEVCGAHRSHGVPPYARGRQVKPVIAQPTCDSSQRQRVRVGGSELMTGVSSATLGGGHVQ